MPVDNLFYEEIASALDSHYKNKLHKYFYSQKYIPRSESPLDSVVPLFEEFYGPKVMTILIVSKPYEYEEIRIDPQVELIKKCYKTWAKYKVLVWMDLVLANKMEEAGDTQYKLDMIESEDKLKDVCEQLKEHGFEYKGRLTEGKDHTFFHKYIDAFYKDEETPE